MCSRASPGVQGVVRGVVVEGRGAAERLQEVDAVGARRGRHPVEGERDVGTHRFALPVGEGPGVLARVGGTAAGQCARWGELGLRGRGVGYLGALADRDRVAHRDAYANRRQAAAGEGDARVVRAVACGGRLGGARAQGQVLAALEVPWIGSAVELGRFEDTRVGVVHRAGRGQRSKVSPALQITARAHPTGDAAENDGAEDDGEEEPEQQHPGLTALRCGERCSSRQPVDDMADRARRPCSSHGERAMDGVERVRERCRGGKLGRAGQCERGERGIRCGGQRDEDRVLRAEQHVDCFTAPGDGKHRRQRAGGGQCTCCHARQLGRIVGQPDHAEPSARLGRQPAGAERCSRGGRRRDAPVRAATGMLWPPGTPALRVGRARGRGRRQARPPVARARARGRRARVHARDRCRAARAAPRARRAR